MTESVHPSGPADAGTSGPDPVGGLAPVVIADLGIGFGRLATPGPMGIARLGAGIERGNLRVLGRLTGAGPSFGDAPNGPAGGVFGLAAVGVAACGQSLGRWRVVGCVATDLGLAIGRGRNTMFTSTSATSLWWGVEGELGVEYAIVPRWAIALRLDGGGVPAAPDLVIEEQGRVCCARWGAGARFGLTHHFGASR